MNEKDGAELDAEAKPTRRRIAGTLHLRFTKKGPPLPIGEPSSARENG
jgi:hypothetical protein